MDSLQGIPREKRKQSVKISTSPGPGSMLRDVLAPCSSCMNSRRTQPHLPVSPFQANSSDTELDPLLPLCVCAPPYKPSSKEKTPSKGGNNLTPTLVHGKGGVFFQQVPQLVISIQAAFSSVHDPCHSPTSLPPWLSLSLAYMYSATLS